MSPTTEIAEQRVFNVLRKDGTLFRIPADTVCEKRTRARTLILTFKREGKVIGELVGDWSAWWIDAEDGSRVYHFEIGKLMVDVVGDEWNRTEDRHVLKAGGVDVATIYQKGSLAVMWHEDRS